MDGMTRTLARLLGTERSVPRYRGRHRAARSAVVLAQARRNPLVLTVLAILALWLPYGALDAGGYLWALEARTAVSVAVTPPGCPGEDGGPRLPCSWRCHTMGDRRCGPDTPPLIIYRRDAAGEVMVCGPVGTGEVCASPESEARIEYLGSDGSIYRLAG